jgi:hypothetical protein
MAIKPVCEPSRIRIKLKVYKTISGMVIITVEYLGA